MAPWPVTLFVSTILLLFAIPVLSFALGIGGLLLARLGCNIWHREWARLPMTLITCAIVGSFAYLFGNGAFLIASDVIDGLIGRFL